MNLSGYINPFVYILFILLLPVNLNKSVLLILAFITGLSVDYFGNTLGLNAAATVMMAFARPGIINLFFSNQDFIGEEEPGISKIGFGGFLRYSFVMVLIHHATLFILEVFSLNNILFTFYRIALSTTATIVVIIIIVLLFSKKAK